MAAAAVGRVAGAAVGAAADKHTTWFLGKYFNGLLAEAKTRLMAFCQNMFLIFAVFFK